MNSEVLKSVNSDRSTTQKADQMLIIERVKIIEYGDRITLIQNPDF